MYISGDILTCHKETHPTNHKSASSFHPTLCYRLSCTHDDHDCAVHTGHRLPCIPKRVWEMRDFWYQCCVFSLTTSKHPNTWVRISECSHRWIWVSARSSLQLEWFSPFRYCVRESRFLSQGISFRQGREWEAYFCWDSRVWSQSKAWNILYVLLTSVRKSIYEY